MSDIKRVLKRQMREKAVVREAARDVQRRPASDSQMQSSSTGTGLPVQDQVRKKWNAKKGGLPIFHV